MKAQSLISTAIAFLIALSAGSVLANSTHSDETVEKTTAGNSKIQKVPLYWSVDVFDELKTYVPSIETKKVYYTKIAANSMADTHFDVDTTDIQIDRKGQTAELKAKGELAKPGDVVTLSYNQKLQVYIPDLEKVFWISPAKDTKLIIFPESIDDTQKAEIRKKIDPEKQVAFKQPKHNKKNKSKEEDVEAPN